MKLFDYLFYRIYKLINFLGNTEFYPEGSAWFISVMFIWLNLLTILNFIELKIGRSVTNIYVVIPIYILFLFATFFHLFRKEYYKKILEKYNQSANQNNSLRIILVSLYVATTVILHLYFSEQRRAMALGIDKLKCSPSERWFT
ncbi:MAG: hypothetical protein ACTHLE_25175 [Agriterribacter sp.]